MSASMHRADRLAGVWQTCLFHHGKGVHVSTNQQTWPRQCPRQFRNHARPPDTFLWTQSELAQLSGDQRGSPCGVEAEFGMCMDVASDVDHPWLRALHASLEKIADGIIRTVLRSCHGIDSGAP